MAVSTKLVNRIVLARQLGKKRQRQALMVIETEVGTVAYAAAVWRADLIAPDSGKLEKSSYYPESDGEDGTPYNWMLERWRY